PLVGTIVYLGVEILPDLYRGPTARQVASRVVRVFDPYRGVREAWRRLELSPTVQNKTALAQEYLAAGQPQDAVALYRDVLSGIHATDPALMLGLARAARNLFEEIRKAIDYGPRYQYRAQREWYELAKRQLTA